VLEGAMERGQKAQRDKENGQITLFDGSMGMSSEEPLPDVEPWSEHERLSFERESLGFYITGHPLEKYQKELERYVTLDLGRLMELTEGQEVMVAGVKQSIKEISTKKGDRMAFLTLEDLHGSVELIIFSEMFKNSSRILDNEGPFIVHGTVDTNGDKPKIRVQQLDLLEDYRQKVTRVIQISLTTLGLTRDDLQKLKTILSRHAGECRVKLKLTIPTKAEAIMDLGESIKVSSSDELVQAVEKDFGTGVVTFL
jgi:DNA polymerase-3 subunit alpha